jgi:hypothetical protein
MLEFIVFTTPIVVSRKYSESQPHLTYVQDEKENPTFHSATELADLAIAKLI